VLLAKQEEGGVTAQEDFVGDCRPLENHPPVGFDVVDLMDRSVVVVIVAAVVAAVDDTALLV